jgi:ATP-dependent DNA helicase DinG
MNEIDDYFVMPSYRKGQKEAISFAIDSFEAGKKFVVLECPTGGGKSAIGMTLCNMYKPAYYITATKLLQDQLNRDFSSRMVNLKGRNAYPCTFMDNFGPKLVERKTWTLDMVSDYKMKHHDCAVGFCRSKSSKPFGGDGSKSPYCMSVALGGMIENLPEGIRYSTCPYFEQVNLALNHPIVSMNFSSYLFQTMMSRRFGKRDLLVIDECHNIEGQLLDFVSVTVDYKSFKSLGIEAPTFKTAADFALWVINEDFVELVQSGADKAMLADDAEQYDLFVGLKKKIENFLSDMSDERSKWVIMPNDDGIVLKPVYIRSFADSFMFNNADNVLMMSATVLDPDVFCSSLGIDPSNVAFYRMKNRFPASNRPIYYKPIDRFVGGKAGMDKWGPKLIAGVEKIVKSYQNKRGIIHTHNNAIMKLLAEKCCPEVSRRFVVSGDYKDKSVLLLEHEKYNDSVIVAPAFHEGVDLRDDLSRFQIICKVPFANFYDDLQLAERIKDDSAFYTWITALKMIQAYGRSIRSESDQADTYVLDACFESFVKSAKKMIPKWFLEAIKW